MISIRIYCRLGRYTAEIGSCDPAVFDFLCGGTGWCRRLHLTGLKSWIPAGGYALPDLPVKIRIIPNELYHDIQTMSGQPEKRISELLQTFPSLNLAILFGSVGTGDSNPDSDIDIAVLAKDPIDAKLKIKLIECLAAEFGQPIDLIDLRTVGEPLLGEILKGTRLFGSNHEYAQVLNKHLVDAADFIPLQQRILKERRDSWIQSS